MSSYARHSPFSVCATRKLISFRKTPSHDAWVLHRDLLLHAEPVAGHVQPPDLPVIADLEDPHRRALIWPALAGLLEHFFLGSDVVIDEQPDPHRPGLRDR